MPAPAIVTLGHADELYLPDSSVDLIVTSPPYFNLRSYQDGGEHYEGQVGAESSSTAYLDRLIACTREWIRVLKSSGSIFVNLGDKYGKDKGLGMLPARYAIRCADELGLIQRAEIIWAKPNGLPESVTDRVRRSHEQVFHFVKKPRYYSAVDEVREQYNPASVVHAAKYGDLYERARRIPGAAEVSSNSTLRQSANNPLGKLPGSVWTIPTAPLRVPEELGIDHFAAYPPELVRRIVLGWSPLEVCTACGEGRRPMVSKEATSQRRRGYATDSWNAGSLIARGADDPAQLRAQAQGVLSTITGYACACPDTEAPATPGVVLDPFGGTGTTALVASVHGRVGISVDLSSDYCRLAQWRTSDTVQRERAARVPKPKKD